MRLKVGGAFSPFLCEDRIFALLYFWAHAQLLSSMVVGGENLFSTFISYYVRIIKKKVVVVDSKLYIWLTSQASKHKII